MVDEIEPKNKPKSKKPGVENVPTFDELPPPGYKELWDKHKEELTRELNLTEEDLRYYEKLDDQETG